MNLEISTVVGCKMNCDYCPQKVHVKTYTDKTRETVMSLDNFKTILSTVPKECEIIFAGMAEPWLLKTSVHIPKKLYHYKFITNK